MNDNSIPSRLSKILFEEIDSLQKGNSDAQRAKSLAMLAAVTIKCQEVAMQMDRTAVIDVEPVRTLPAPENRLKNTVAEEELPIKPRVQLPDIPKHLVQGARTVRGRQY